MTISTSTAIPEEWHYDDNGQRKGPVPASEMERLIAAGKITYGSMVWKKGSSDWQPVENSELNIHLHNSPPPLTGTMVNNTIVWTLAFAPVLGVFLQVGVAAIAYHDQLPYAQKTEAWNRFWYVNIAFNLLLAFCDERFLTKCGINTGKFKAWFWLPPVYMFKRARALKHNLAYFIIWIITLLWWLFT